LFIPLSRTPSRFCAAIGFGNFLLKPGAIVDDIALPGGEGTFQRWFNL